MRELAAVKTEVKKSRFYAHLYVLDDPDEITEVLDLHRKAYRRAAHHCSAVRFLPGKNPVEATRNDGEVGHPGKALLAVLEKHALDHHALVVSRIFGGIKLGPGGVTRAFRDAGEYVADYYRNEG
ncbi:YigZ family protein [Methanofollis aquaemaris]|uniref:YigZ family protein n=1 Tax=Methanofollis aquaemaris TaxID=126734 RepID=A0A8A3S2A3_9EURY|nr:YigZ family protein [Methanofollis aquaemaris]QSZ66262.1 YigZ family protein [Methanofollis aquaemaris]